MLGKYRQKLQRVIRHREDGYLLPTVIILGLAIGTVSVLALQTVANNSVTVNSNYYDTLAQEAAQAGVAMAQGCIGKSVVGWTDANMLRPNSDCNGIVNVTGVQPSYVAKSDNYESYFEVKGLGAPTTSTRVITATGYVELKNPDGTRAGDRYKKTIRVLNRATVSGNVSKDVTSLAVGYEHTCVAAEGKAYCWGNNANGQLGLWNSTANQNLPVAVDTNLVYQPYIAPSSCLVGAPLYIGCSNAGQSEHKVSALANKTVKKITAGNDHTCALTDEGRVYCWGDNAHGQLGDRTNTDSTTPVAVDMQAVDIPAVPASGCGIIICSSPAVPAKPKSALATATVVDIQAGQYYTCALTSAGTVACWGENSYGQLGVNDTQDRNYPVEIYKSDAIAAIPASGCLPWPLNSVCSSPAVPAKPATPLFGKTVKKLGKMSNAQHTCVIASDNLPYCWGRNYGGQVGNDVQHASEKNSGNGGTACPSAPGITTDNDALQPAAVYVGGATSTTTYWGWGPTNTRAASGLNGKTVADIGTTDTYTTALGNDGRIYWWGGTTGVDNDCSCKLVTVVVKDSKGNVTNTYTKNQCDGDVTRYYRINSRPLGPVYNGLDTCWFVILKYSCGNTTAVDGKTFQLISGAANTGTFCGLTGTDVYCQAATGSGNYNSASGVACNFNLLSGGYRGQIGDGTTPIGSLCWTARPTRVAMDGWLSGKSVTDIGGGASSDWFWIINLGTTPGAYNCVLASKQVACWGDNDQGQLGTGNNTDYNTPTPVSVNSPLGKPGGGTSTSEVITF